jgi:hypothetical protein
MDVGAREHVTSKPPGGGAKPADLLPVRMLNESVYCPRLFYLMHVMGEWALSADTVEGRTIHRHVDRRQEPLPAPDQRERSPEGDGPVRPLAPPRARLVRHADFGTCPDCRRPAEVLAAALASPGAR